MGVMRKLSGGPGSRRAARAAAAVLAAAVASAGLVAAGGGAGAAAAAGHRASPGSGTVLGAGQAGARSAVPWRRVGPGWVLAEYWNGRYAAAGKAVAAPASLYLVDPAGGRYQLYRTAATTSPPVLVDWSGDKTRALLRTATAGGAEQVTLATGAVGRLRLAGQASVIGYSRPSGLNLLGWREVGSREQLARYSLTGAVTKILATGTDVGAGVYSGNGTTLAVGAARGVQLVSNSGAVIRSLPVAGTSCGAVRWWNSGTILASCLGTKGTAAVRVWLVPAGGGRPRALSLERAGDSGDLGDIGAWQLPSGLYFQGLGPCGTVQIFRQRANGSVTLVTVPHSSGNNRVLGAYQGQLLVQAPTGCSPTAALLWFNPSTRHEHTLLSSGVLGAVPYGLPDAGR
jgi:TolB protein